MFNNSMIRNKDTEAAAINQIQADTIIEGDIKANGGIRIDGTIKGSVNVKGKLVVGATGIIEGEITCQNADIAGTITGTTNVSDLLSLKSTAKLNGDIIAGKLSIEPGANFTGSCKMGAVIKDIKYGEQPTQRSKQEEKTA